jgi:DNA-directed RNA polymerase specialized sigma24 family protein
MASVTSEAVKEYWPLFEYYARRYAGVGGAEFDDLVQEAAEAAWIAMELGYKPHEELIRNSMRNWVRYITHRGIAFEEYRPVYWALQERHLRGEIEDEPL